MNKEEYIKSLLDLVAIDSVAYVDATDEMPYGKGPHEVVAYIEKLCGRLGIKFTSCENKTFYAEIGGDGADVPVDETEIIGVLGHIDIVPFGDGWTHKPTGEICGDTIYGRGVIDDKGPVLCALYAMKDILDSKIKLKHRIRLIFGMCEEQGEWTDMEYYKATQKLPVFGFTPDADFPAIYGEKGIARYELKFPRGNGITYISGGDAVNMVPGWCKATVAGYGECEEVGKCAHASLPEQGDNAISHMMERLALMGVKDPVVEFYTEYIGFDLNGNKMGCGFKDEQSGLLTMNAGVIKTDDDFITLSLDIREPVSFSFEELTEIISSKCEEYGADCICVETMNPVYMDKNGPVISTMVNIYRDITGDITSEPEVIGGGTYARAMDNIVAFGVMIQGRENTEHSPDEHILLEDLFSAQEIYRQTLLKLDEL